MVSETRVETVTPAGLVDQARRGHLRLPSFQRSYRWTPQDVEELFDSILRRYPIGSLLFWERPAAVERLTLGPLVLDVPAVPRARWVVDGQQRITSIVGALAAPDTVGDPRFAVYLDLETGRFRAVLHPPDERWLPLRVAASASALEAWRNARWGSLDEEQLSLADEIAVSLQEYRIPSYVIDASDESEIRTVFERLNYAGHSLRAGEVFGGLQGARGPTRPIDLADIDAAVAASGFGFLGEDVIRRSLLALRGPNVAREMGDEFADDDERLAAVQATQGVLLDVVAWLREDLSVPHVRLLPRPSMVPVLAAFVGRFGRPSGRTATLLRRWFWRGSVASPGPAAGPPQVRRTVQRIVDAESAMGCAQALLADLDRPVSPWRPDLEWTSLTSAEGRVNVLGLLALEPRELHTARAGPPFMSSVIAPAQLVDAGTRPLIPLVAGDAGPLNRTMANRLAHPPFVSGEGPIRALLDATPTVRASHGIDPRCATLLAEGRWEDALSVRAELLRAAVEGFVDGFAEWGALDRPTAAELILGSG